MQTSTIWIERPREVPMAPAAPIAHETFADAVTGLRRAATLAVLAERLQRIARESVS